MVVNEYRPKAGVDFTHCEKGKCTNCSSSQREQCERDLDLLHTPLIHNHNADGTCPYAHPECCAKIFVKPAKKSAKKPDKPNLSQAFQANNPVTGV